MLFSKSYRKFDSKKFFGKFNFKSTKQRTKTSTSSFSYADAPSVSGEVIPWGVSAVWQGEDITQRGNFASDTYAFVIDSGVLNTTGDLNFAPADWSKSWITGQSPFTDANGHGTHIAGTIGALVNGKGIVGVAPGAQIVSLKVNNDSGFGDDLTTIDAINHAVSIINNNNLDKNKVVVTLSISGTLTQRLNTAIKNAADQGIRFSIAAGNFSSDVDKYSPGSAGDHPNVYTASAVDKYFKMPSWSNWDRLDSTDSIDNIDFAAPGDGILSYYRNGQLSYLTGTSQASAHIAGLLLTGGVQAGGTAIPTYENTADPVALSSIKVFDPSYMPPLPPTPITPPTPTYVFTTSTSLTEGQKFRVDIQTTNVTAGSYLYWQISGTNINYLDDFRKTDNISKIDNPWGSPVVAADGTAFVEFNVHNDQATEGDEVMKFELFDQSSPLIRKKVGEASITIQDTSKTPAVITNQYFWGTAGNDMITGVNVTSQSDYLTGVLPTGTTLESIGKGQVDILTGNSDRDVFVLGDSRGIFYNDGIRGDHGSSDYALIKNFKSGEDKIQSRGGTLTSVSNGNLFLYIDMNRNTRLETTGPNRDELISVIEGVTSLTSNDFIYI